VHARDATPPRMKMTPLSGGARAAMPSILGKPVDVRSPSLPRWMPGQRKNIQPGVYPRTKPALRVHREDAL